MNDRSTQYILFGSMGVATVLAGCAFMIQLAYADELFITRVMAGIAGCF